MRFRQRRCALRLGLRDDEPTAAHPTLWRLGWLGIALGPRLPIYRYSCRSGRGRHARAGYVRLRARSAVADARPLSFERDWRSFPISVIEIWRRRITARVH